MGRVVDDRVEGVLVRDVVAVGVGHRHDRERPVAVARGVVLRARRDHLGAVAGESLAGACAGDRGGRGRRQVAPHDRGELRGGRGSALQHECGRALRAHGRHVPGVGLTAARAEGPGGSCRRGRLGDGGPDRSRDDDPEARDGCRGGVAHDDARGVGVAGLDPADSRDEGVLHLETAHGSLGDDRGGGGRARRAGCGSGAGGADRGDGQHAGEEGGGGDRDGREPS